MKWAELTSPALNAVDRDTPVVVNIAAIEQHGPHLPLATDAMIGQYLTDRIDAVLGEKILIAPQVAVCCSRHHLDFVGTLTVRHETLFGYLTDLLGSIAHHGFRNLVLFNSHGGNLAIGQVVLEAFGNDHPKSEIFLLTWWRIAAEALSRLQESGFGGVGHACEFETSLMLQIAPELCDLSAAVDQRPVHDVAWEAADMLTAAPASHHRTMHQLSAGSGVSGCPSFASAEKGRRIADAVVDRAAAMLADIRDVSGKACGRIG